MIKLSCGQSFATLGRSRGSGIPDAGPALLVVGGISPCECRCSGPALAIFS